jgi:hypothetical protein
MELTPEFRQQYVEVVEGRDFIKYDGLMELAHDHIASIEVELIALPAVTNLNTAVVKATITDTDGRKWSALGDASDTTCAPELAPHKIRIAETRAKGRALRDMLNIGMPMYEEVFPTPSQQTSVDDNAPITLEQIARFKQFIDAGLMTKDEARDIMVKAVNKESLNQLTRAEADALLKTFTLYVESKRSRVS